jgi:1,4-alpha-glucan branching enzyme
VSWQDDPQVAAIVGARHDNPFSYLGMHRTAGGICVRAMLPQAEKMAVVDSATGEIAAQGVRFHPDGLFLATSADRREPFRYRLHR